MLCMLYYALRAKTFQIRRRFQCTEMYIKIHNAACQNIIICPKRPRWQNPWPTEAGGQPNTYPKASTPCTPKHPNKSSPDVDAHANRNYVDVRPDLQRTWRPCSATTAHTPRSTPSVPATGGDALLPATCTPASPQHVPDARWSTRPAACPRTFAVDRLLALLDRASLGFTPTVKQPAPALRDHSQYINL